MCDNQRASMLYDWLPPPPRLICTLQGQREDLWSSSPPCMLPSHAKVRTTSTFQPTVVRAGSRLESGFVLKPGLKQDHERGSKCILAKADGSTSTVTVPQGVLIQNCHVLFLVEQAQIMAISEGVKHVKNTTQGVLFSQFAQIIYRHKIIFSVIFPILC